MTPQFLMVEFPFVYIFVRFCTPTCMVETPFWWCLFDHPQNPGPFRCVHLGFGVQDEWSLARASIKYLDMGMFFSKAQMIADSGHFLQVNIPISSHIPLLWWLRVGKSQQHGTNKTNKTSTRTLLLFPPPRKEEHSWKVNWCELMLRDIFEPRTLTVGKT